MSKTGDRKGGRPKGDQVITDVDPLKNIAKPTRVDSLSDDFASAGIPLLQVGDLLAERYALVRHLGQGAMGEVWLAENVAIGLQVAVKMVKPELLADGVFRKRFQREAQAIAAIKHPRVGRVIDLVVGQPTFLVMEYVEGATLQRRIADGKMSVRDALGIALGLCDALEAAHRAGVIHRDLKPSNVILGQDGAPNLIDFGLAKLSTHKDTSLTATGQMVGTPYYMSPEQVDGKEVDQRSDVYSLGCVLFEMIAGRPPFEGKTGMQVLYKHVHEPPPSLELPADLQLLNPILARAMAKDPAARPASMTELRAQLAEVLGEPAARTEMFPKLEPGTWHTQAHTRGPKPGRLPPWLASRNRQLGAVGVVLLALLTWGLLSGPSGGTLIALSTPRDAKVFVDGKPVKQTTPAIIAGLPAGKHRVRIVAEGYSEASGDVELKSGAREAFEVSLRPKERSIEVSSTPDGASVFLLEGDAEGRPIQALGMTPMTVAVTVGDFYRIRLEKAGYEAAEIKLTPDDSAGSINLPLSAEKQPRGALMVDANEAAQVWIDGVYTGFTTPTIAFREPVGDHVVELRSAEGLRSAPLHVTIRRGETRRLYLSTR